MIEQKKKMSVWSFVLVTVVAFASGLNGSVVTKWSLETLARRRNHACATIEDTLFLAGGRFGSTVEAMPWNRDPSLQRLSESSSLFEVNHIVLDVVGSGHTSELWISCGFIGHTVNHETHLDHVVIINPLTLKLVVVQTWIVPEAHVSRWCSTAPMLLMTRCQLSTTMLHRACSNRVLSVCLVAQLASTMLQCQLGPFRVLIG